MSSLAPSPAGVTVNDTVATQVNYATLASYGVNTVRLYDPRCAGRLRLRPGSKTLTRKAGRQSFPKQFE